MKAEKYDRQLRLWGRNGQQFLSSSKVCALGSSTVVAEILKSLILPGIGEFLIVDDSFVSASSYGENFFLTPQEAPIGAPKAEALAKSLQQLNPEVVSHALVKSPHDFAYENGVFKDFSIVIASNPTQQFALHLDQQCRERNIPLLIIRSRGMVATLRVSRLQHTVMESHTSTSLFAPNLQRPWKELEELSRCIDLQELDDQSHAHIPFIILIIMALRNASEGATLEVYKKELGKMKRELPDEEKNFTEAMNHLRSFVKPYSIPQDTVDILKRSNTEVADKHEDSFARHFWVTAKAVSQFVEKHNGILPNAGVIPDMTADSVSYLTLQQTFRNKAESDVAEVQNFIASQNESISHDFVKTFCRHAQEIKVIQTSSLQEELARTSCPVDDEEEEDMDFLSWYAVFEASDEFQKKYGRPMGDIANEIDEDLVKGLALTRVIWERLGCSSDTLNTTIVKTFVSAGNTSVHSIAAYIGGVAAQEVTKLLCRQYVPIDNTYIFNGYTGLGKVLQL